MRACCAAFDTCPSPIWLGNLSLRDGIDFHCVRRSSSGREHTWHEPRQIASPRRPVSFLLARHPCPPAVETTDCGYVGQTQDRKSAPAFGHCARLSDRNISLAMAVRHEERLGHVVRLLHSTDCSRYRELVVGDVVAVVALVG